MSDKSKAGWGWVAFGFALALCVVAGAVAGVLLGNADDADGDAGEARRVAALALDTRGLNDDALALSQAIEAAIEREELEGEAATLRAELSAIEQRAERIRARTGAHLVSAQAGAGTAGARRSGDRRAQRGLREVRTALGVFEHEVVDRFDSLLVSQPASESEAIEELGQATQVLEQQNEAMSALSSELDDAEPVAGSTTGSTAGGVADAYPVSGAFGGVVDGSGVFTVEYEVSELSAETEEASEEPGVTLVGASASGRVEVENPAAPGGPSVPVPELRMVLYWAEAEVPVTARQAELRLDPGQEDSAAETTDEIEAEAEAEPEWGSPCRYELAGDRFCALAGLDFAADAGGPLAPGEGVELEADEASVALALYSEDTDPLTTLLQSDPPDLIQVVDAGPEGLLRPACTTPALDAASVPTQGEDGALAGEATDATLGLLEADGAVVFEAAPTAPAEEVPCFEVRDE